MSLVARIMDAITREILGYDRLAARRPKSGLRKDEQEEMYAPERRNAS